MPWILLTLAGLLEVAMATFLHLSAAFTRPLYTIAFLLFAAASFTLLALAVRTIPLGTAYAVWTGIGAFGTAIVGILIFKDPATTPRLIILTILISSVIALKFVTPSQTAITP